MNIVYNLIICTAMFCTLYSCNEIHIKDQPETKKQYSLKVKTGDGKTITQKITKQEAEQLSNGAKIHKADITNKTSLKLGTWIHKDDSKAGLKVTEDKISIFYTSKNVIDHSWYKYYITNTHPKANTDEMPGNFIHLVDKTKKDTLSYEILNNASNDIITLLHLDSGKTHIYHRETTNSASSGE